ncbi:hypothetical protein EU805_02000 [Salipiger sp. IMCC34102]|uniref:hypothetical protein n=1 Tax=Salipiger sp. IMCC34102 TaxID=2510647 RepID=UPI00101DFD24|nr:hypothetical protein [Salipiger sp. IMCC34102]RYH04168.1 hypothetical protein EU805_02000 [Salipiger sp. IMCC34102]
MKPKTRKFLTAGTTFCVALGIGSVMQYGDALADRIGYDAEAAPQPATGSPQLSVAGGPLKGEGVSTFAPAARVPVADTGATEVQLPGDPAAPRLDAPVPEAMTVAYTEAPAPQDTARIPRPVTITTPAPAKTAPPVCKARMTAEPQPLAMVQVTVEDGCRAEAVVTIHHQGMMFQGITDAEGVFTARVPALSEDALFLADFGEGSGAVATASVPEVAEVDRAVLQWQGDAGVELHALEFGAAYFGEGHLWAETPGDTQDALAGTGGVITRLGDGAISDGLMAEVYTYPSGTSQRDGTVALSVEAAVTSGNCGREVAAQSIQVNVGAEAEAVDLVMTMPGCEAQGEYLVLKNMFEDLTLAAK